MDKNRTELLQQLMQLTQSLGRPPMKKELDKTTFMRLYRCFGGLKPALKELGLKYSRDAKKERVMGCAAIVVEFHRAGLSAPKIAERTGISLANIHMILEASGIPISFRNKKIYSSIILSGRDPYQPAVSINKKKFSFSIAKNSAYTLAHFYEIFPEFAGKVIPRFGFIKKNCFDENVIHWVSDITQPLCEHAACVPENVIVLKLEKKVKQRKKIPKLVYRVAA